MSARLVAGADGRYLDVNREALDVLGRSRETVLASRIGDFAGPHGDLARTIWARLAGAGQAIPTGEASIYRADGNALRVRYTRITRNADGAYELEFEPIEPGEGPPTVDKPSAVLDAWRAAERERELAGAQGDGQATSDALRALYHYGMQGRAREPRR